jgi:hypothetical protein
MGNWCSEMPKANQMTVARQQAAHISEGFGSRRLSPGDAKADLEQPGRLNMAGFDHLPGQHQMAGLEYL